MEPLDLLVLPPEELGQHYAGDGQGLLGNGGHLGIGLLHQAGNGPSFLPHLLADKGEKGHHPHGHQGQFPGEDGHGYHGADQNHHVGDHVGDSCGDHIAHSSHVVGHSGLDLPGAGAGEEVEGQALEMAEQPVPQVSHDPLADGVGKVGLEDADAAGDGDDARHEGGNLPQQVEVGASGGGEQGLVENHLDQQGVDYSQPCGEEDQQTDQKDLGQVGPEGCGDAREEPVGGPDREGGSGCVHGHQYIISTNSRRVRKGGRYTYSFSPMWE